MMSKYQQIRVPDGDPITIQTANCRVSERPSWPLSKGDGTGPDIWAASVRVLDERSQSLRRRA
jgi:isocitrate dehydrogenase